MSTKDDKVIIEDKVTGTEVAALLAVLVIVLVIVYLFATGVSNFFKQQKEVSSDPGGGDSNTVVAVEAEGDYPE